MQTLQQIIDLLNAEVADGKPYFGIFSAGTDREESCIEANTAGLKKFASALLETVLEMDQAEEDDDIYYLDSKDEWIDQDSTTFLRYVAEVNPSATHEPRRDSPTDMAFKIGCIAFLLIFVISSIIGIVTIFKWIF